MKIFEKLVLEKFQESILGDEDYSSYIIYEDELIRVIFRKGMEDTLDLFFETSYRLDNIYTDSFVIKKIINNLYKVVWTDMFLYIIGEISIIESGTDFDNDILAIARSNTPLSNYIKSLK